MEENQQSHKNTGNPIALNSLFWVIRKSICLALETNTEDHKELMAL
jgi:hypothetical protein